MKGVVVFVVVLAGAHFASAFMPQIVRSPFGPRGAQARPSTCVRRNLRQAAIQMKSADPTALSEFSGVDAEGNQVTSLNAKENLYLDCCAAFNVDGKSALSDEEYEQLKTDLTFEGSKVMLMSREEIKFMVAARRYREVAS